MRGVQQNSRAVPSMSNAIGPSRFNSAAGLLRVGTPMTLSRSKWSLCVHSTGPNFNMIAGLSRKRDRHATCCSKLSVAKND